MKSHQPNSDCLGNYDLTKIAYYAHKRFIEGCNLMELIQDASSNRKRQEIILVAEMQVHDNCVDHLQLSCLYKEQCKATNCRHIIKDLIEQQLNAQPH